MGRKKYMREITKEPITMKIFPKGQVVIPIALRKKYNINIGDLIDVIPELNGILVKPATKRMSDKSITEQLFGVFNKYATGKPDLTKADIKEAVEKGFTEGGI
jgi:AbrB family looped-hinge helix DNA binding protein